MTIIREEIFGPVLAIMPFDTEEECAITPLTLHLMDWPLISRPVIWIVHVGWYKCALHDGVTVPAGFPAAPFGGYKQSGVGRSSGMGIEEFLEIKTPEGTSLIPI